MKSFKNFLSEAYSFFPETAAEIESGLTDWSEEAIAEVNDLLDYLKEKYPRIDAPINIDKSKSKVNVTRQLQDDIDLSKVKSDLGLSKISLKFGNGSSGNRGANNRGNAFESSWANVMEKWWAGEPIEGDMADSVRDVVREYDLDEAKQLSINVVGGENTRRPLNFSSRGIYLENPKGTGNDVGPSVTDITLQTEDQTIYLSLKLGGTTTFFNVGVRTILRPSEIKDGDIQNEKGLLLLKTFGIDPDKFCKVFNQEDIPRSERVDNRPKVNRRSITTLLQSGIGFGYHIIHKLRGRILSKKMDESAMKKAAQLSDITVYYGGMTGTGRRIDVVFESPSYEFKINIRDTQGGDGYPTRMMCDFKNK
jgi:hypothetical protein